MITKFFILHKAIKNRADFIEDKKKYHAHSYWPLKDVSMNFEDWNNYVNRDKNKNHKKDNRVNLVFTNFYSFNNEIYDNTRLLGIKKFSKSFDKNVKVVLDGKNNNFFKFNKNNIILGNIIYRLLFSNIERANKSVKITFYYIQVILFLIILLASNPQSITVGHLHKYWQVILAAKILNINTYHFMHGVISYTSSDTTKELLNKYELSIADVHLFPTKISLYQFKSIESSNKNNYIYLNINKNDPFKRDIEKKDFISILGTWFLSEKENLEYLVFMKRIISNLRANFKKYEIYYLPHIMTNENIIFKNFPELKRFQRRSEIIYSYRTISFFSTLGIELYEKYNIPPIFVPLYENEEEYIDSMCSKIPNAGKIIVK